MLFASRYFVGYFLRVKRKRNVQRARLDKKGTTMVTRQHIPPKTSSRQLTAIEANRATNTTNPNMFLVFLLRFHTALASVATDRIWGKEWDRISLYPCGTGARVIDHVFYSMRLSKLDNLIGYPKVVQFSIDRPRHVNWKLLKALYKTRKP